MIDDIEPTELASIDASRRDLWLFVKMIVLAIITAAGVVACLCVVWPATEQPSIVYPGAESAPSTP